MKNLAEIHLNGQGWQTAPLTSRRVPEAISEKLNYKDDLEKLLRAVPYHARLQNVMGQPPQRPLAIEWNQPPVGEVVRRLENSLQKRREVSAGFERGDTVRSTSMQWFDEAR